ncbi:MAG TPA: DUF2238 domain-containing protein [Rhodocyclaceae bacterium]|nr:DUF2238 domain-containing protein [Rhodocyclaceae bacterium]HMZ83034.1 DUF2238 domain-containing protein [Rhodocyclaceae bacterium]HNA03114.1 DUF2238 domain-containing protein [Rhodocyclaceae bacterium]HNB78424.1 DUF2238 domain-containing protein [Rhodocyclaceae bacterium]HNC60820.1 DUF2238 domain-containing protein [Rhodocyclaceae bacterium]
METGRSLVPWVALGVVSVALAVSGVHPHDRLTWLLEVAPVVIGIPLLLATGRTFPLSHLLYALLAIHALILIYGGAYTYARVPLGFWMQDWLDLARNPYDRLGHFAQGFVPAIAAREILLRRSPLRPGKWLAFLVVCVCLAISATYELIEWLSAVIMGQGADEFLGTQGDSFDTQADMAMALLGAVIAQAVLARRHDRDLTRLALMRG